MPLYETLLVMITFHHITWILALRVGPGLLSRSLVGPFPPSTACPQTLGRMVLCLLVQTCDRNDVLVVCEGKSRIAVLIVIYRPPGLYAAADENFLGHLAPA